MQWSARLADVGTRQTGSPEATFMHIPFIWFGAFVAGFFLMAVMTLFGLALKLLTHATDEVRGSVLPGLISGFRGWADDHGPARPRPSSPRSPEVTSPFEEIQLRDGPPLRRVHARVH
jgi:hypothetical protein